MTKWIELNNGELVNLDLISNIRKYFEVKGNGNIYEIEYNGIIQKKRMQTKNNVTNVLSK